MRTERVRSVPSMLRIREEDQVLIDEFFEEIRRGREINITEYLHVGIEHVYRIYSQTCIPEAEVKRIFTRSGLDDCWYYILH